MSVDSLSGHFALDLKGLERIKHSAARDPQSQLKTAANQFEALFLQRMLKSMRDAMPKSDLNDSSQMQFYQSMFDQQMAQHLAGKGFGLAQQLIGQLSGDAPAAGQHEIPRASPQALYGAVPAAGAVTVTAGARAGGAEPERFISQLAGPARAASRRSGVPAELILAQAALETGWGRREITTADGGNSHNLFGIKATGGWAGASTEAATHEYVAGERTPARERFRVYRSYDEAFADHARLLGENPRYAGVVNADSPQQAAVALQQGGYATDPAYASKLIAVMERIGPLSGEVLAMGR
ncbi:flagellar assembly peptidoglycan hydrolase FlgJ [Alloalcanivorax mobilis]|uniref:flagellar assembly peptidoglycan hydrolase FlgJ n=1 Tax=Alloalcanivorax mobilis TaxID=2019569 RepID=UPI000B5B2076|nr:flagellar assembly peptidoglycan hydrolase FlgJ [Alloalcanivorax mobilis]ASK34807.1 flagellar assembly peptidoglycan hydrolase FlgJ [Alcanivorax sp. N3-2A]|tara:strand:- start:3099 stop:3989 length:891 start_codon:yes stop_codon:yes gene_type:complete